MTAAGRGDYMSPNRAVRFDPERALTGWMFRHLPVIAYPYADRSALGVLEEDVLDALDPPLNLEGRTPTPLRAALSKLRAGITAGSSCSPQGQPANLSPARSDDDRAAGATRTPADTAVRSRTLNQRSAGGQRAAGRRIDARRHLERLVGTTVHTIAVDEPNRVLGIEGVVVIGTRRSPSGKPMKVARVQYAID